MIRTPNGQELRSVFVVGAPRCGTTFISKILREHPKICFSKPKEPHYFSRFCEDVPPDRVNEEFLIRCFGHLEPHHEVIAEGSSSTLYAEAAFPRILDFDADARILITVRNPVDMAYSHHQRMIYTLDEDERDFARAWALQEDRLRGRHVPKRCRDERMLQYREVGSLGSHVERVFKQVGRERCFVSVYDDMVADPRRRYVELLEFIGVEDDGRTEFKRTRQNMGFKSAWLQQYVINPPKPIAAALLYWHKKGVARPEWLKRIRKRIRRYNTAKEERVPLGPELREQLSASFAPEVRKLEELLGRDLSHWS